MTNHVCNGDAFERHGIRYGRCLLDSAIFTLSRLKAGRCPECRRRWEPVDEETTAREMEQSWYRNLVTIEIDMPALARLSASVMKILENHGPGIVPHLMDTDENDGERLRNVLKTLGHWPVAKE